MAEQKSSKLESIKKWGSGLVDLAKNAVGNTRREQIGTGVTAIGGVGVAKNILGIFGIGEFDLTESALAVFTTLVGLGVRLNPKNVFGIDAGSLVDAPSIDYMALDDTQAEAVADKLGISVAIFREAADLSQMEPAKLETKIRERYGDLLDRINAGKPISSKEKNLVTCIQHFARLNELVGQGKVIVTNS